MKKITLLIISITTVLAASAQQFAPAPSAVPIKKMTVAEANKLNGTAMPTINGIPYSQYKAQQEALKASQPAVAAYTAPAVTAVKDGGAPAATTPGNVTQQVLAAPGATDKQPASPQATPALGTQPAQTAEKPKGS